MSFVLAEVFNTYTVVVGDGLLSQAGNRVECDEQTVDVGCEVELTWNGVGEVTTGLAAAVFTGCD